MQMLFTLSGCITYTFTIIYVVVLLIKLINAFRGDERPSIKAMLFLEVISIACVGTLLGMLFQNYARTLGA